MPEQLSLQERLIKKLQREVLLNPARHDVLIEYARDSFKIITSLDRRCCSLLLALASKAVPDQRSCYPFSLCCWSWFVLPVPPAAGKCCLATRQRLKWFIEPLAEEHF